MAFSEVSTWNYRVEHHENAKNIIELFEPENKGIDCH